MFRVKICGITRTKDAELAARVGADAIGLNFYPKSPRCCPLDQARKIAAAVPDHVCRVGVFVDASAKEIRETAAAVPLDAVQLCGNETPELLREVCPLPIVRVARFGLEVDELVAYLEACHRLRSVPRMLLADAHKAGHYGGTGTTLDWELVAAARTRLKGIPLALAGGLTPKNVSEAVGIVRPWAVDVASGVESKPGVKSAKLVEAFVAAAREALDRVARA